MARDYELGIVVNPDVGDEQARAIVERITHVVATHEGQVVRVNAVGRRRLAYPIDHHRDGLYFYFDLTLGPTSVTEIERSLRVNEDIIRHLILVRDPRVVAQLRAREAEAQAREAEAQAREAEAQARAAESGEETKETPAAAPLLVEETAEESPEQVPVGEAEPDEAEPDEAEPDEAEPDEAEPDDEEPDDEAESEAESEAKA